MTIEQNRTPEGEQSVLTKEVLEAGLDKWNSGIEKWRREHGCEVNLPMKFWHFHPLFEPLKTIFVEAFNCPDNEDTNERIGQTVSRFSVGEGGRIVFAELPRELHLKEYERQYHHADVAAQRGNTALLERCLNACDVLSVILGICEPKGDDIDPPEPVVLMRRAIREAHT